MPRFVLTDFEQAAINAFKYPFPGIKTKVCHFHYCQALWKKMIEFGMKAFYENDFKLRDWLRLFMALSLVPCELVKEAYDQILNCKPAIQRFLSCFEKQSLKDVKVWNHFDTDGPRTNNYNEGYDHRLNRSS